MAAPVGRPRLAALLILAPLLPPAAPLASSHRSRRRWVGDLVASTAAIGGLGGPPPPAFGAEAAAAAAPAAAPAPDTGGPPNWRAVLERLGLERDEVVRVLDANTIKLRRVGLVTFAAVSTPSGYNPQGPAIPECMAKSPSSRARTLLPVGSRVRVLFVDGAGGSGSGSGRKAREALVVAEKGNVLVNAELVRSGFARPVARGREGAARALGPDFVEDLRRMEQQAKDAEAGFYVRCDKVKNDLVASDDQFEPLQYTVETKWGDDGGKQIVVQRTEASDEVPPNPRDTKGCSDFDDYEDALRHYEFYLPYYGDVAKLDRDGDGVPCPGLPHTKDQVRYRMKVPTHQK